MNKKIFMAILTLILNVTLRAGDIVTLYEDDTDKKNIHRNEIPVVTDNGTSVTITSDSLVCNVRVVIKDTTGGIIYNEVMTILPSDNIIYIPEEYQSDKYSIELYYEGKYCYGFFENKVDCL